MSPGRGVPTLGLWSFPWHPTACSSLKGGFDESGVGPRHVFSIPGIKAVPPTAD